MRNSLPEARAVLFPSIIQIMTKELDTSAEVQQFLSRQHIRRHYKVSYFFL